MTKVKNPRFPHTCRIWRTVVSDKIKVSDNPDIDEDDAEQTTEAVCYEGKCRSYDHDTTSDKGDVITQLRNLALPLKQDEWTGDTIPQKGDWIEVDRISYKEKGTIIDRRPNNLGTTLLWRLND